MPEDKTTINRTDGAAKPLATNIAGRHQSALRTNAARALQTGKAAEKSSPPAKPVVAKPVVPPSPKTTLPPQSVKRPAEPVKTPAPEQPVRGQRTAVVSRKTGETDITLALNLDGFGNASVDTGIGFFDHMLNSFARHGFFDLEVKAKGDLYVDCHHTIEDTGIVLGTAIKEALGEKKAIKRFGSFMLPMDEALVRCALDLSGRPYLVYDLKLSVDKVGYMDTEMVKEFFYAVSYAAGMNLNIKQLDGQNNHHIIEAAFKAFAKALDEAVAKEPRLMGQVLSTKGTL